MIQLRRSLALCLALALAAATVPVPALAGGASLQGRVLGTDGAAPRGPVTVALYDPSGQPGGSGATDADGAFTIETVAPGTFALLVDAPEGTFAAAEPVELEAGANPPILLSLAPAQSSGFGSSQGRGWAPWLRWTVFAAIGVVAVLLIADVSKDDEPPASAF